MFNKLFRNLLGKTTKESAKETPPAPVWAPAKPQEAVAPTPAPQTSARAEKKADKKPATPSAPAESKPITATEIRNATLNNASRIPEGRTPDELCEITPGMDRAAIEARLAMLYRRHNRAASSFDEAMREEAETMLEAIAAVRDKHLKQR
jgi:delta 1-pyrroline-5-carboxylate dehydrogenase